MGEPLTLVECRAVEVRRRGRTVLGPLDLELSRGEFWGVVGPNGAGKSTLLRTIAGLEPARRGELGPAGGRHRRRPGLLFQHQDFAPELPLTVADVVAAGRADRIRFGWLRRPADREAVDQAIGRLGLEPLRDRLYRELSGGERQKVQLARLVAQQSELLLLDEPAAGLDLDWQGRLTDLIAELHRATGVAVVMVTHEVQHLPSCCDHALLLDRGRVLAAGRPGDVFTPRLLSELYGCRIEVVARGGRYWAHSVGAVVG